MSAKHNHSWRGETGTSRATPTYRSWQMMRDRCYNRAGRNYENYGARGISVSSHWFRFVNFLADMGERPPGRTLDRIDNDGNYEPGNCRWATFAEQSQNQRTTKLSVDDVLWIRAQVGRTYRDIAADVSVGRHMVSLIMRRERWINV